MIPNVSDALDGWTIPVTLKTVIKTTVDFKPTVVVTGETIEAVVQPTQKTRLNADTLDWQRQHITLHSPTVIANGQFVEFEGADYKVVESQDWTRYGYCEAVCEATKQPLLVVTL